MGSRPSEPHHTFAVPTSGWGRYVRVLVKGRKTVTNPNTRKLTVPR